MTLLFTLHHRNKENDGAAYQSCHRRSTIPNPYIKRVPFSQPLTRPLNQNQNSNLKQAPCSSVTKAPASRTSAKPTSTAAISRASINDDSPITKEILAATGCASVDQLLATRAPNSSMAPAPNGSKAAAMNGSKAPSNVSKSTNKSTNGSKAAPNVAKNVTKSTTTGSTNPKKKAKSVGQSDLSIQSQSHIEPHSRERSLSARTDSATSTLVE